jgi:hypothetical protein
MKHLHERLSKQSAWYKRWHSEQGHEALHWAILALFYIATLALIVSGTMEVREIGAANALSALDTQESAHDLTNAILQEVKGKPLATLNEQSAQHTRLLNAVTRREAAMKRDLANDPQQFLLNSLPADVYAKFPPDVQAHLEKRVEVTGVIRGKHIETLTGTSQQEFFLFADTAPKGEAPLKISVAVGGEKLPVGKKVKVTGVAIGSTMALADSGTNSVQVSGDSVQSAAATEHRVLAILINFAGNTAPPVTPAQVEGKLFTDPNSVSNFYTEQSYDTIHFYGDVTNWLTITNSPSTCNDQVWATAARAAATSAGYDLSQYQHVIYFYKASSCDYTGWSWMPGSEVWINGYNDVRLFSHELGHNLGVNHATTLSCTDSRKNSVAIGSTCTSNEYGDQHDVMGSWIGLWNEVQQAFHFNAAHKYQADFLPSSSIETVTTGGTYTIKNLESSLGGTQALRVAKSDTNEYYYIDYRQKIGFDAGLPDGITGGAHITIYSGEGPLNNLYNKTKEIDTTPGSFSVDVPDDFKDASLSDGKVFTDSTSMVKITQVSHSADSVTVSVEFTGTPLCVKSNPTITSDYTSKSGLAGQKVSYVMTVRNNNSGSCGTTVYHLATTAVPPGFTSAFAPSDVSIAAGTTGSVTLDITSPSTATDGTYPVNLSAIDVTNSTFKAISAVSYVVSSAPAAPTNLTAVIMSSPIAVKLTWKDNSNNEGYFGVLRSSDPSVTPTVFYVPANTVTYTDTGIIPGTTYSYWVGAVNQVAWSASSNTVVVNAEADTIAPSLPMGLSAVPASASAINLSWAAAMDNAGGSGIKGYKIYRNGSLLKQTTGTAVTASDTGLAASTLYTYEVSAVDYASNESGKSASATATTPAAPIADVTKPTASITAPVNGATVSRRTQITLTADASDNVGVTKVAFYLGSTVLCTDLTSPYTCVWKVPSAPNKTYTLQAQAYDAAGNIGASNKVTVSAK